MSRINSMIFAPAVLVGLAKICSPPAPSPPQQYILNDTSLAALHFENDDRQLFFQDVNGTIRRAIYTASTSHWTTSRELYVPSSAKNHTPLAVVGTSATEVLFCTSIASDFMDVLNSL